MRMASLVPPSSAKEGSELQEQLSLSLQALSLPGDTAAAVGAERSSRNPFLRPLSFPEPETKDLSHFVDSDKDVPIMCMVPTCSEVFGGVSQPGVRSDQLRATVDGRDGISERTSGEGSDAEEASKMLFGPKDSWLRHLLLSHKIVIDKVSEISSLRR